MERKGRSGEGEQGRNNIGGKETKGKRKQTGWRKGRGGNTGVETGNEVKGEEEDERLHHSVTVKNFQPKKMSFSRCVSAPLFPVVCVGGGGGGAVGSTAGGLLFRRIPPRS